ncbi:MAG: chitobiase/beta-hexosaminidase C-terminal domain-containing protein [Candidatus Cloacimonetes bacterium]|nr:chitobiase/beta-hexosaminidase C-terminal domain-containing protein [Candidatus Cloacimonadota bacterium]
MKRITLFLLILILAASVLAMQMIIHKTDNTEVSISISEIESITFEELLDIVATPTFDPPGGTYTSPQTVTIFCATKGATIRYTTDGTDPTESSPEYTIPKEISKDTTLKARAYKDGWIESEIAEAVYTITRTVASPEFNPPGGTYKIPQVVTITCATEGATIRYTTDGTDPTESSPKYTIPIEISKDTTLKARAYKDGWIKSEIAEANYIIDVIPGEMIFVQGTAGVTFSPGGFGYFNPGDTGGGSYNVSLSDFYIGTYEVTQAEYSSVMAGIHDPNWTRQYGLGDNYPAYKVSWFNAIEYCNRLSMMEGLTPAYSYSTYGTNPANWPAGWNTSDANHTNVSCNWSANGYRLPTEMEREYAARGGVPAQNAGTFNSTYAGTNLESQLVNYAWYDANSGGTTHPVGTKLPNELRLYDMSGNVWNWVWDIWDSYPSGSYINPTGATSGSFRVRRGGGWSDRVSYCTVSHRAVSVPSSKSYDSGFRVCRISP